MATVDERLLQMAMERANDRRAGRPITLEYFPARDAIVERILRGEQVRVGDPLPDFKFPNVSPGGYNNRGRGGTTVTPGSGNLGQLGAEADMTRQLEGLLGRFGIPRNNQTPQQPNQRDREALGQLASMVGDNMQMPDLQGMLDQIAKSPEFSDKRPNREGPFSGGLMERLMGSVSRPDIEGILKNFVNQPGFGTGKMPNSGDGRAYTGGNPNFDERTGQFKNPAGSRNPLGMTNLPSRIKDPMRNRGRNSIPRAR